MRRPLIVLIGVVLLVACGPRRPPAPQDKPKPAQLEGGREATSPSRRTSEGRPQPWQKEHPPFDSDRFGIGAARVHKKGRESRTPTPDPTTTPDPKTTPGSVPATPAPKSD